MQVKTDSMEALEINKGATFWGMGAL